jgi:hypothetical protein
MMASLDQTVASYKRSITYYQKAQAICNLLGLADKARLIESSIAMLKDGLARCGGDDVNVAVNASTLLQGARYNYEFAMKTCGSTSEATLRSGSTYATELVQAHRGIEAERLIVKLAAIS